MGVCVCVSSAHLGAPNRPRGPWVYVTCVAVHLEPEAKRGVSPPHTTVKHQEAVCDAGSHFFWPLLRIHFWVEGTCGTKFLGSTLRSTDRLRDTDCHWPSGHWPLNHCSAEKIKWTMAMRATPNNGVFWLFFFCLFLRIPKPAWFRGKSPARTDGFGPPRCAFAGKLHSPDAA